MKIRTISDLPEITGINSDDLFMVSRESTDNAWSSKKLTYETLETSIADTALVSALNSISVAEGTNVGKRLDYVDGLSAEVSVHPDHVKFAHAPRISNASAQETLTDDQLTTRKDVINLIDSNGERLSPASYVSVDPRNDQGST